MGVIVTFSQQELIQGTEPFFGFWRPQVVIKMKMPPIWEDTIYFHTEAVILFFKISEPKEGLAKLKLLTMDGAENKIVSDSFAYD